MQHNNYIPLPSRSRSSPSPREVSADLVSLTFSPDDFSEQTTKTIVAAPRSFVERHHRQQTKHKHCSVLIIKLITWIQVLTRPPKRLLLGRSQFSPDSPNLGRDIIAVEVFF